MYTVYKLVSLCARPHAFRVFGYYNTQTHYSAFSVSFKSCTLFSDLEPHMIKATWSKPLDKLNGKQSHVTHMKKIDQHVKIICDGSL